MDTQTQVFPAQKIKRTDKQGISETLSVGSLFAGIGGRAYRQIDAIVYGFYGLDEAEIGIV